MCGQGEEVFAGGKKRWEVGCWLRPPTLVGGGGAGTASTSVTS